MHDSIVYLSAFTVLSSIFYVLLYFPPRTVKSIKWDCESTNDVFIDPKTFVHIFCHSRNLFKEIQISVDDFVTTVGYILAYVLQIV